MADDAEIYYQQAETADPNLLFLLDTSGSMNAILPNSGGKSRMQVMQDVFAEVMSKAPENLNVGLMRYGGQSSDQASGVSFPIKPIEDLALPIVQDAIALNADNLPDPSAEDKVRKFLADVGYTWRANGYTPIVDALYEAGRYFRGESVDFGNLRPTHMRAAHPASYTSDDCSSYKTSKCDNSAGQCSGEIVDGSCQSEWQKVCTQPGKKKEILNNQCCQWKSVENTGQCCKWVPSGFDEGGRATGWQCKDNNYSCTTNKNVCVDNNYSCTREIERDVCLKEENVEKEFCKHKTCKSGRNYTSPLLYECQSNYIVLMSDGRPQYRGGNGTNKLPRRTKQIKNLTGKNCATNPSGYKSGTCGPELAEFLLKTDLDSELAGDQSVQTFTVAFALDDPKGTDYLKSLATVGEGNLSANSAAELERVFAQIFDKVTQPEASQMLGVASTPSYGGNQPHLAELRQNYIEKTTLQEADPLLAAWGLWQALVEERDFAKEIFTLLKPNYFNNFAASSHNGFFTADDVDSLTEAFTDILERINASASSFSSPSYSINKSTLLSHNDEVFIPVFESGPLPRWSGNVKKFKLKNGQLVGRSSSGDEIPVLDENGRFLENAWDFWGESPSGAYAKDGGAASLLKPENRRLYTDPVAGSLSALAVDNAAISKELLGDAAMSDELREKLLAFVQGYTSNGSARKYMGDVMNSRPLLMDYGAGKSYVLFGSNEGFLHVLDAETGEEKWAFMPSLLLKNINTFYENTLPKQHIYGVDGRLTLHIEDKNHDGKVDADDGDKAYLYFGLRRGGHAYYALDITNINTPKILWSRDASQNDFRELGETWSKPTLAKMRVADSSASGSSLKNVLIFGAGFDAAKEEADPAARAADSMGRDVFIIDAQNGALIWSLRADVSGAAAQLQHSIPGDIRILDMDRNGALDRLYFTDTGGNLWRVDMDMDVRDNDSGFYNYNDALLTHMAALGGNSGDSRKFYYEPDVALMRHKGETYMTISMGTGYRSHPLSETILDRFYVLLDEHIYTSPPAGHTPLQDLDITSTDVLEQSSGSLLDGGHKGWSYTLPNQGEKVLAPSLTILNKVVFTTFDSEITADTDPCGPPPNKARAYVLDLFTGEAVANLDRSADGSKEKSIVAGVNEILDVPQVIFQEPMASDGGPCTPIDCVQGVEIRVGKMNLPLMDAHNSDNASGNVAETTDLSDILPRLFWNDLNVSIE